MTDVDVVLEHGPGHTDPQNHVRCAGCGYRWPCPDELSKPAERSDTETAVVAMVGLGWHVEGHERLPERDRGPGIVVHFSDDPETEARSYRCMSWLHGRPTYFDLAAADIDPMACVLPNSSGLRNHARQLARHVGAQKGTADAYELRDLETATHLMRQAV